MAVHRNCKGKLEIRVAVLLLIFSLPLQAEIESFDFSYGCLFTLSHSKDDSVQTLSAVALQDAFREQSTSSNSDQTASAFRLDELRATSVRVEVPLGYRIDSKSTLHVCPISWKPGRETMVTILNDLCVSGWDDPMRGGVQKYPSAFRFLFSAGEDGHAHRLDAQSYVKPRFNSVVENKAHHAMTRLSHSGSAVMCFQPLTNRISTFCPDRKNMTVALACFTNDQLILRLLDDNLGLKEATVLFLEPHSGAVFYPCDNSEHRTAVKIAYFD